MKIYNSLTDKIEEFTPIEEGKVTMYVCGPTVYNYVHIGNMRPVITFDMVYKYLKYLGYDVTYASNFTDINPKITMAAKELSVTEREIADKFIKAYLDDLNSYNCSEIDARPRVIDHLDDIFNFINKLIEKDYAYVKDGDVYFRVSKIKDYGVLSNQDINDLLSGARVEIDEKKENSLDFALWRKTDEGETFDSPWGKGIPGWHTECVAMINDITEHTHVDIHGGGMDLKFPHHENEEAQSYAYCNHSLASIWMHNGMLNINNEKMSKSAGNFILGKDIVATYGGQVVRWVMNATHYRAPINFSDEIFDAAISELNKIYTSLKQASLKLDLSDSFTMNTIDENYKDKYLEQLADDMNVSGAMTILYDVVKELNQTIRTREVNLPRLNELFNTLNYMLDLIGMNKYDRRLTDIEKALYNDWVDAKTLKDFVKADEIRKQLIEKGIL